MMLCNQPEAFASDIGDDHSRYLWTDIRLLVTRIFDTTWRERHTHLLQFLVACLSLKLLLQSAL